MELVEAIAWQPVVARAAFAAGGVDYTWGDVVAAARLRGDWAAVEREAGRGLAALAELHARGEEIDPIELEGAGVAFRYERDLLSGDEMEAWLERWDLSSLEWTDWLGRALARERLAGRADELVAEHGPDRDEVETAAAVEAVCSGALELWAHELAERAAVALASGQHADEAPYPDPPSARGILALAPGDWEVAAVKVAPFDVRLDRILADTVDQAAIARELGLHRLDWLAFDLRSLPARWTLLALRGDGAWTASHLRWAAVLAVGVLVLAWTSRERRPRARAMHGIAASAGRLPPIKTISAKPGAARPGCRTLRRTLPARGRNRDRSSWSLLERPFRGDDDAVVASKTGSFSQHGARKRRRHRANPALGRHGRAVSLPRR